MLKVFPKALVLKKDFLDPDICWRDDTARNKQSRKLLESMKDNFLTQLTEETISGGDQQDLILTNKKELIGDVNIKGSLGWSAHKMGHPEGRDKKNKKITTLDFGLFRELLGRFLLDKALEGRGVQES